MVIFSKIWPRDTGLILVMDEVDEEYSEKFIDWCIWIHPWDRVPILDTRTMIATIECFCVLWLDPYGTWHANLSCYSVKYLRNSITKVIDGVLSLQCVIDDSWRFWDPCRAKAPCLALHDCFVGRLIQSITCSSVVVTCRSIQYPRMSTWIPFVIPCWWHSIRDSSVDIAIDGWFDGHLTRWKHCICMYHWYEKVKDPKYGNDQRRNGHLPARGGSHGRQSYGREWLVEDDATLSF